MTKNTAAKIAANQRYNAKNTTLVQLRLNHRTDADILAKLEGMESKTGYIKELIRADISKSSTAES